MTIIDWTNPDAEYYFPRRYRTRRVLRLIAAYTMKGA